MTMQYWKDGRLLIGRIKEHPNVLSQGYTVKSLEANIRDALALMVTLKMVRISYQRMR